MKILRFFGNLLVYIAIVAGIVWGLPALLSYALKTEYPIAAVTSSSMWPALKAGDLVVIRGVPKENLAVGDIVVWQHSRGFTIHRIVELNERTITTKGDANFPTDPPVRCENVIGKAVIMRGSPLRIPYLGRLGMIGKNIRDRF